MADQYDVIIIGGGPGGYNCAIRCGQLGLKVACVETRKTLGGTCLNVGCIPSKALLHSTALMETVQKDFPAMGLKATVEADVPEMIEAKNKVVTGLTQGIEYLFKKNNVERIEGFGRIKAKGEVEVDGKIYKTNNIVIATGSEVAKLPGVEIDEKTIVSSTGALDLQKVPENLLVIGGGVIGLELGSVWRRLGAKVTVVEFMPSIMVNSDKEIQKAALRMFKKQGMKFELSRKVMGIEKSKSGLNVKTEAADGGKPKDIDADVVLVCIGRKAYTDGLGLENVGIETDNRGRDGPMLAHKAEEEGVAVAESIAGQTGHVNYAVIPDVVYTHPEIASVGQTEEELKEAGIPFKRGKFPFTANSRARCNHEAEGFAKILAHAETDEILGAHILGPLAGDLIHEVAVAMEFKAASEDLARTCHAHPTVSEAVRQAAMDVEGWAMQM